MLYMFRVKLCLKKNKMAFHCHLGCLIRLESWIKHKVALHIIKTQIYTIMFR